MLKDIEFKKVEDFAVAIVPRNEKIEGEPELWDCYLFKGPYEKKEFDFCKWMYYEYNKNYSQIRFNSKKKRDKVDKMFDQIKVFIENDVRNFDFFADMMNELFINHYMYDPNIVNVVIKSYTLY